MKQKIVSLLLFIILGFTNVLAYITYPKATLVSNTSKIEVGEALDVVVEIMIPPFAKLLQEEEDIFIEGWEIQDFYFKQDIVDECKFTLNLSITTFDSELDSIPRIKLSYVNKEDLLDDSFFCDKFYFFSNSVPIKITSVVSNYQRNTIFDMKNMKRIDIPIIFYVMCLILLLFVFLVVYRNILMRKVRKYIKVKFSPKENAIRNLNNIRANCQLDENSIDKNYCLMSQILKKFILAELKINRIEMTTSEVLAIISKENNLFYESWKEIAKLFKVYDNAKYSVGLLVENEFMQMYDETKKIIYSLNSNVEENFNEKNIEENK